MKDLEADLEASMKIASGQMTSMGPPEAIRLHEQENNVSHDSAGHENHTKEKQRQESNNQLSSSHSFFSYCSEGDISIM